MKKENQDGSCLRVTSDLHTCLHTQMHVYTHARTHSHTHTPKTSHENSVLSPDRCHLSCVLSRIDTCVQLPVSLGCISPTCTKSVVLYVRSHAQPPLPLTLHGLGLMLLAVPAYQQPWRPCVSRSSELIGFQSLSFRG